MRAVVQRVSSASVVVEGRTTGKIGHGMLILLGVETGDTEADARYIAGKCSELRIFNDSNGKMNLSLKEVGGAVLAISQFTLHGDCRRGRRPSFTAAAHPDIAIPLYELAVKLFAAHGLQVETGVFGAHMKVRLVNDGPVTMILDSRRDRD